MCSDLRRNQATICIILFVSLLAIISPIGYGQTSEIQDGLLQVLVKKDGIISKGEYSDAVPYRFTVVPETSFTNQPNPLPPNPVGYLYAKHDTTWTYFGFDFVSSEKAGGGKYADNTLFLYFDTHNTNNPSDQPVGLYVLTLNGQGGFFKEDTSSDYTYGTPFRQRFLIDNCQHYCWQSSFGPSANDATPHQQLEVQIRNDVLFDFAMKYQNTDRIGFVANYYDVASNMGYHIPASLWPFVPLNHIEQALPEFVWAEPTVLAVVLGALVISRKSRKLH